MEPVTHIDITKNDWRRSEQRLVARVYLQAESELLVETFGDDRYREVVLRPVRDPDHEGSLIDPSERPVEFFKMLPDTLRGSYLSATRIHYSRAECPFAEDRVVKLKGRPLNISV